ncbi:UNKNOWN [Stylonychia lemnae]|uniref:Uncharacterized protein n=1 Tax=Stylonychia lemnae TaxID=5949 RepID=A0A078AK09_STYLE|nr:UNKNOWN [Stylonychia lemnae]|eukprot:CDW82720.1 UNKNOWN [Stylonychia lemnae]
MISLENLDDYNGRALLNSPRSLEACQRIGLNPKELIYKPIEDFKDKNLDHQIVQIRYQHHESKRRELLYKAKKERGEIIKIIETNGDHLKPGSFIQPLAVLQHQNLDYSKSVVNIKAFNSPSSQNQSQISSPQNARGLQPTQSQPQLSLEQSRIQAFQQLQKQGIIDDNVNLI